MGLFTAALGLAGLAVNVFGQAKAGSEAKATGDYNAAVEQRNAAQAAYDAEQTVRRSLATQRVLYAKAGVDISSGSPAVIMAASAAEGARSVKAIKEQGAQSAAAQRLAGSAGAAAGYTGAFSTLLTGLGQARTDYLESKQAKAGVSTG